MSYDPSGSGLFPEAPLDEPDADGYRNSWRRGGGTAGASLGALEAMANDGHVYRQHPSGAVGRCVGCGRPRSEHKEAKP